MKTIVNLFQYYTLRSTTLTTYYQLLTTDYLLLTSYLLPLTSHSSKKIGVGINHLNLILLILIRQLKK